MRYWACDQFARCQFARTDSGIDKVYHSHQWTMWTLEQNVYPFRNGARFGCEACHRACELVKWISMLNDTTGICFNIMKKILNKLYQYLLLNVFSFKTRWRQKWCFFTLKNVLTKQCAVQRHQTPSSTITQTWQLKFYLMSKLRPNNKEQSFKYKHCEVSNNGKWYCFDQHANAILGNVMIFLRKLFQHTSKN